MSTQTFTRILTIVDCANCGMSFGITADFEQRRRDDHASFYCPVGHSLGYSGKSDAEQLRTQLKVARESERFYRQQMLTERRRTAAQRGQRTRLLNLIAKGICPVPGCRRNFSNVREHMQTEHPDFHRHEDQS